MARFEPQVGDTVRVCYDGKRGRCVAGKVVGVLRSSVQVAFPEWGKPWNNLKSWFSRASKDSFGGFVEVENSLMQSAFGCPGDYYSVQKMEVDG